MPVPTKEQVAILEAAATRRESLMINAYAGCGKTTTLEMIAKALPPEPALAIAFNVSTKKTLEKRFPENFTVMTLNGLGHRAWGKAIGKRCEVDEKKLGKLVSEGCKAASFQATQDQWNSIRQLVSAGMMQGIVPARYTNYKGLLEDTQENWIDIADDNYIETLPVIIDIARWVLIESVKLSFQGVLTYDDQIYMSSLYGGVFPRFGLVLVDEAQDLSPLNHIQVKRTAAGRLIVVGDAKQSIYAFRGADHESIAKLRALRTDWIDLPLNTTFRCPKVVVGRQQEHAPGFIAWETNAEGKFESILEKADPRWDYKAIATLTATGGEIAFLCRNNAPLLSTAFKLIRAGIGVTMLGRDIGKGLVALSRKILPLDDIPVAECIRQINQWEESEINIARANEKEGKVAGIEDRAACLIAVLTNGEVKDSGGLRKALEDLFENRFGSVVLSTGHRAKGLEWDTVVHLDPWRIPSKYARSQAAQGAKAQLLQELNLKYVIETRTKHTLVQANVEDFVND